MDRDEGGADRDAEIAALRTEIARQAAAARAERDRLAFELGHRVKNTLSMVQALANQTFRSASSKEDGLAAFGERIAAMSRASDAILIENWTRATLGIVAPCVLQPRGAAIGPLTIDGPTVPIGPTAALSFAMALHELATNARRFGAWSAAEGTVTLAWRLDNQGDVLDLRWTERGGPATAAPGSRGFGLRYAEQSLRSAFGREVVFDFRPEGLECRVRAPAGALGA